MQGLQNPLLIASRKLRLDFWIVSPALSQPWVRQLLAP
jgi:hypothetical protein